MKQLIILGAESSGKSTLARGLSEYFDLPVRKEYARTYFENHPYHDYAIEDIDAICLEQEKQTQVLQNNNQTIICDTDALTLYIWQKEKFGYSSSTISATIQTYDFNTRVYIVCYPDLEWQYDPLREHPRIEDRMRIFDMHKEILEDKNASHKVISGNFAARTDQAIAFIDSFLIYG